MTSAQTEDAPRIEINSQTIDQKKTCSKNCLRILHVDDDLCFLEVSKQILTMENNFDIDTAVSVDEAFKKMEKQSYDAIIADYEMPLKNGLDFLRELREQNHEVPFILFTGKGREDIVVKALNLGADRYINKNGSPETVYCELADAINKTVERKKSRQLLAKSESNYRTLAMKSLQGIVVILPASFRLVFANDAMGKIVGCSSQELLSFSPDEIMGLIHPEDRDTFFKRMINRFQGEPSQSCNEYRLVRKDGSTVWMNVLSERVDYDGQPAVMGMFLDISESKKNEEILREGEKRYRELANFLPIIIFETDLNGKIVFSNEAAHKTYGYSSDELKAGLNIQQFHPPEERDKILKDIESSLVTGNEGPFEYTYLRKNGTTFPGLVKAAPIICQNKLTGMRGVVLDVSERKKAEAALKSSAERFMQLANSLPEIIFETDLAGKGTYVNQRAFEATGYTQEDFNKGPFNQNFLVPESIEKAKANFANAIATSSTIIDEYILKKKDGSTFNAIIEAVPIKSGDKTIGLRGIVTDITEQKKSTETLVFQSQLLEAVGQALIAIDKNRMIQYWNKAAENLYGWTAQEVLGKNTDGFLLDGFSQDQIDKISNRLISGESCFSETQIKNRNGKMVPVIVNTNPVFNKEGEFIGAISVYTDITEQKKITETLIFQSQLLEAVGQALIAVDKNRIIRYWNIGAKNLFGWSAEEALGQNVDKILTDFSQSQVNDISNRLMSGESWQSEIQVKHRNETTMPVIVTRNPVFSKTGEFIGSISIFTDITEQKCMEEEIARYAADFKDVSEKVKDLNEKLRVIGGLTMHDVRNKLAVFNGYMYLLKKKIGDNQAALQYLTKMDEASNQLLAILDFEKVYEQVGSEQLVFVNVNKFFAEACGLVSDFKGINQKCECDGLEVLADSLLRQLIYNLINNTLKYGEKTTLIRLYHTKEKDGILLVYEDNGAGMTEEVRYHLFEKGFGKGTGFGLYMTKRIIDTYGWKIEENGKLGVGARFTMKIPENKFKLKESILN